MADVVMTVPQGATHAHEGHWYRIEGREVYLWADFTWALSTLTPEDVVAQQELPTQVQRSPGWGTLMADCFRNACRVHLDYLMNRYLMANAEGRWNGTEKANVHQEMTSFYVAAARGLADSDKARVMFHDDFNEVREATRALTDNLDVEIGFPLKGHPDYEALVPRFFDRFHQLATDALGIAS